MVDDWRGDLKEWLAPFLAALRHKTRMRLCPAYIAGLIGPGDRKSVQPMAARDGEFGYDQLHHFVAEGVWDSAPLETILLNEADRLVGDEAGYLVIDDTALPKKGSHSVGVRLRILQKAAVGRLAQWRLIPICVGADSRGGFPRG